MSTQRLPAQRQLLESLVVSLSSAPPSLAPSQADKHVADASDAEEVDRRRRLLLTLHVLFPDMVLSAPDLLDRKLVTRFVAAVEPEASRGVETEDPSAGLAEHAENAGEPASPTGRCQAAGRHSTGCVQAYFVRSLASTLSRRGGRDPPSAPRTYAVHLDAWSCSCAGFALDAFAHYDGAAAQEGHASTPPAASPQQPGPMEQQPQRTQAAGQGWLFGGMSSDGRPGHGEDVPCCKHLLACLLAETWGSLLGTRVDEKRATREEMAGMMAIV